MASLLHSDGVPDTDVLRHTPTFPKQLESGLLLRLFVLQTHSRTRPYLHKILTSQRRPAYTHPLVFLCRNNNWTSLGLDTRRCTVVFTRSDPLLSFFTVTRNKKLRSTFADNISPFPTSRPLYSREIPRHQMTPSSWEKKLVSVNTIQGYSGGPPRYTHRRGRPPTSSCHTNYHSDHTGWDTGRVFSVLLRLVSRGGKSCDSRTRLLWLVEPRRWVGKVQTQGIKDSTFSVHTREIYDT